MGGQGQNSDSADGNKILNNHNSCHKIYMLNILQPELW